ncbi:hypothetical protein IWX49DRAFT_159544 [Phyllosticta citricarpa]|uniref:Uncharacterized protein n=1 Tax=Phyllosticta citricarpa TaxID=55181 RepID=A0ABR1M838_9PEZI
MSGPGLPSLSLLIIVVNKRLSASLGRLFWSSGVEVRQAGGRTGWFDFLPLFFYIVLMPVVRSVLLYSANGSRVGEVVDRARQASRRQIG